MQLTCMGEGWGGHAEVGLFTGVVARGSSLLKLFSLGLVVGPCTWAKLGGLLNLADLKKKPNGPHWIQMDSRPIQKKNDKRSK